MRRKISRYGLLASLLALTVLSCADTRLVEDPIEGEREEGDPYNLDEYDHLHDDGNWYAGWAVPISPEVTSAAMVDDGVLYVPRTPEFDRELDVLTPMDIMVGASEDNGFVKRVLGISRTEDLWEIAVVDASLTDVFLEGSFRFDVPPEEVQSTTQQELNAEGNVTTYRQGLESGEPADDKIEADEEKLASENKVEAKAGIDVSWNPNIKPRGDDAFDVRTLLRFDTDLPPEKKVHSEMCEEISGLWSDYVFNKRNAKATDDVEEDIMKWALKYAGHSPFPPYLTTGVGTKVRIQKSAGANCPDDGKWYDLKQFDPDGESAHCFEHQNRFVVRPLESGGYTLFDGNDESRFNHPGDNNERVTFGPTSWGLVYHAMAPGFTAATVELAQEISKNGRLKEFWFQGFDGDLLTQADALTDGRPVNHGGEHFTDETILLRDRNELERWDRALGKLRNEMHWPFSDQNSVDALVGRGIVSNTAWLRSSVYIAKAYCSGAEAKKAQLGAGLKMLFTHSPQIKFKMGAGVVASQKQELVKTTKTFAIGPVPVYLEFILNANFQARFEGGVEAVLRLREHLADVDFFYVLEMRDSGKWDLLTLEDFPKYGTEGTKFKLFESPQPAIPTQQYRNDEPMWNFTAKFQGTAGFQLGLGVEVVLYKLFGAGFNVNFGTELTGSLSRDIQFDLTQGPTADFSTGLKLPICPAGVEECAAADALKGICKVANGILCNNGNICGKRPWKCPSLDAGSGEFGIKVPVFDGCSFPWEEPTPICQNKNWDAEPRALPPCLKACYRSAPTSGHRWIALQNPEFGESPANHSWAGTCEETSGFALDHIYVLAQDDSRVIPPKRILKDQNLRAGGRRSLSQSELQKVSPCSADGSCARDINACSADQMKNRALHFTDTLLVEFEEDIAENDILIIEQQEGIPRTQSSDQNTCGFYQDLNVLVGAGSGAADAWEKIGETNGNSLEHVIPVSEFTDSGSGIFTGDLSTVINLDICGGQ